MGMKYGYTRLSTDGQSLDTQVRRLPEDGKGRVEAAGPRRYDTATPRCWAATSFIQ